MKFRANFKIGKILKHNSYVHGSFEGTDLFRFSRL